MYFSGRMNEAQLWQSFLQGDKKALSDIFLSYHNDLYRYGKKIAGNSQIVEDCIQDLFLKLWNNKKNLKKIDSIKPYLLRSLRNHIMDSLEFKFEYQFIENEFESLDLIVYSHEDFLINEQVNKETIQKVVDTLNKLKPRQKEIIYLRYFQDIDFEMSARIMNMNIQSARNLLSRALQTLRDLMVLELFFLINAR